MSDALLNIDFSKLTPIEQMFGHDFEETQQLTALFEEAELYLASLRACDGIKSAYFGLGVSDFIGVFLFEIFPSNTSTDRFLWVVAGDVPPAHLETHNCPNPVYALRSYIRKTRSWCDEVLSGNVDGAAEVARDLMGRVRLLDTVIMDHYTQELSAGL